MSHGQLALLGVVIGLASAILTFNYLQGNLPKWGLTFLTAVVSVSGMGIGIGMAVVNGLAM